MFEEYYNIITPFFFPFDIRPITSNVYILHPVKSTGLRRIFQSAIYNLEIRIFNRTQNILFTGVCKRWETSNILMKKKKLTFVFSNINLFLLLNLLVKCFFFFIGFEFLSNLLFPYYNCQVKLYFYGHFFKKYCLSPFF